jgi:hypothetical protein
LAQFWQRITAAGRRCCRRHGRSRPHGAVSAPAAIECQQFHLSPCGGCLAAYPYR